MKRTEAPKGNNSKLESELKSLPELDEFARDKLLDLDPFTQKLVLNSKNLSDFKAAIYNREPEMAAPNAFTKNYWSVERYFIEKAKMQETQSAGTRKKIKGVMDSAA